MVAQASHPELISRRSYETAKLNEVDPHAWLADVLTRLPEHPAQRLHELLPWAWETGQIRPAAA